MKDNYNIIKNQGLSNENLERYFIECFDDIVRLLKLYKCWTCISCLERGVCSAGPGDKSRKCPTCNDGQGIYEIANFQARASKVGAVFEYACMYLLSESFTIPVRRTSEITRVYDFEIRDDIVIEAKGSPERIINADGTKSDLSRPGLMRSDTMKKALENATQWRRRFPNGRFYIITNALPIQYKAYRDEHVSGIYDITKSDQLDNFVRDVTTALFSK